VASGTTDDLYGVGCASTGGCLAVGDELHDSNAQSMIHDTVLASSSNAGASWNSQIVHPAKTMYLRGASCSTSGCVAAGYQSYAQNGGLFDLGAVLSTANGGALWTTAPGDGFIHLGSVTCATASFCVGVGEHDAGFDAYGTIVTSTDGGVSWTTHKVGTLRLHAVSCAGPSLCIAVGEKGAIVTSTDGGATWTSRVLTSGNWLYGVSCPSTSLCVVVGGSVDGLILTSTDGGAHWTSYSSGFDNLLSEEGPVEAEMVQCATSGGCTNGTLRAVNCPSTSFCVAVGDQGTILTTTDAGASWTSQVATGGSPTTQLMGVSCASTAKCAAVGQVGLILHMS
jgi:photosystem II stability/assembly factor-like uncharacterized protein